MYTPSLIQLLTNNAWTSVIGNRTELEYYSGVETGNPSGSTDNLKRMLNYNGLNELIFVENFEYNDQNQAVKIFSSNTIT